MMRTPEQKEWRNLQDRERRRQKARSEGRECVVGRPALDPNERERRKRACKLDYEKRPRTAAYRNAQRKEARRALRDMKRLRASALGSLVLAILGIQ
jgi:hypothetical protein